MRTGQLNRVPGRNREAQTRVPPTPADIAVRFGIDPGGATRLVRSLGEVTATLGRRPPPPPAQARAGEEAATSSAAGSDGAGGPAATGADGSP